MIAFDLDGCLIGSRELIRQSYREAGAEPPQDFMTLGHHNWIKTDREQVHGRKNVIFLRRLAADPLELLPPWQVAEMLHEAGQAVAVLTGAPEGTLQVLAKRSATWPFSAGCDALSPSAKTAWLATAAATGVFVDDQRYVKVPAGWRFVHYTGQDADELCRQVS